MQRDNLVEEIILVSSLRGRFRLRSGQVADQYFDKYRFESDPVLLRRITKALAELLPAGTEVLAGLELGGVPLATALSLHTGLPMALVRKQRKEYGTERIAEGAAVEGRRVCIVEDVVTTGGQVALSAEELRKLGAAVEDALCVIYRGSPDVHTLSSAGIRLRFLFEADAERGLR
jgi:orotate phosphoribosyltransferase